jgi:hypothetical protein
MRPITSRLRYFWYSLLLIVVTACAGEPYGSFEANRGHNGYMEQLVGENEYFLRYAGTTRHSHEDIEVFWERRATELCSQGYEILERKREKSNDTVRVPISGN